MTDVVTTGGAYVVGEIVNDQRGISLQTGTVMDQGNLVNPGIVMSLEFFLRLELRYTNQTRLKLRTASVGSKLVTVSWTEAFILKINSISLPNSGFKQPWCNGLLKT